MPKQRDATLPVNTDAPYVSGDPQVGATLTSTMGLWENMEEDPHTYAYQWMNFIGPIADAAPITAATGATYAPVAADVGRHLYCLVTAANATGQASAPSNSVGPITQPAQQGLPPEQARDLLKAGHRLAKVGDPPTDWITSDLQGDGTRVIAKPETKEFDEEFRQTSWYLVG